jgi:signal transduction histidine kinase
MQFMSLVGASARDYDAADVALAEELARRAAVALDNARLYMKAERRAREEQALREAVGAVGATFTTQAVMRQIAESSMKATRADGAFVTWVHADRNEVEVAGLAGDIPPPLSGPVPYAGTYTERVTERDEPLVIRRLAQFQGPLGDGPLARGRPDWSALVVPLDPELRTGALFLLRKPESPLVAPDEIVRAHTFAKLAALAFRKLQLLEESERRREELTRLSASRARLMRGFTHDVKNPLGAADAHAQMLQNGILGELSRKQRDSVWRIRTLIQTSLRLIQDLMELARAEAGEIEIQREQADVASIAREVAEDFRAQAVAGGLVLEARPPTPVFAETDGTRVRQILGNLVSNAVKYTRAGSVTVVARTRTDGRGIPSGEWITVTVSDTGPGIPEEKRERIFQEFTRLDPAAKPGAGVGLAISRRIARLLGGDVTVESEIGRGSAFTLWVPVSRAQ